MRVVNNRFLLPACLSAALWSSSVLALEPFVIDDIRVEGLQRISAGTVFNYLPLRKGDRVDEEATSDAIRALFRTGFFENVVLEREGETLVVFVEERPAVASIDIEGNDAIPTDRLTESLKELGLSEGRVFDPSLLDRIEQELKRQYLNLGKYNARITTEAQPLERNRVAVRIDVAEGEAASIKRINIVGNEVFEEGDLLDEFQLGTKPFFSWFSDRDQYSKQRLSADLETLRSYYMDRGYLNFQVESTQVTITPDRRHVYITINVVEGDQYRVSDVRLAGDPVLGEELLRELISVEGGEVFSRREVTESSNRIAERLGDEGYAFANLNPVPEVNEEDKTVALTFFVDPGNRVYVRRVNVAGNTRTQDEVVRRELRQMEGAVISTEQVKRSRTRLDRTGFFDQVTVETPVVPGTADQVDVNYTVDERDAFGSLNFGIGYGDSQGFLVNASVTQDNFLGTGQRFSAEVNNSEVSTVYSFSFNDPYYTLDGISRGFNVFYRETDAAEADLAEYTTDAYGAGVTFGIPMSEWTSLRLGTDYQFTRINMTDDTSDSIRDFCADNAGEDDCSFNALRLTGNWSYDTRNRAIFPDRGSLISVGSEVAVPGIQDEVTFWKLNYRQKKYFPMTESLTFLASVDLGYGDAYGDTTELPPFERFYAGGVRTVRGYEGNSLGPRDASDDPIGGDMRVVTNLEVLFPAPFAGESDQVRLSGFVDGGNVYIAEDGVDLGEMRWSAGVAMVWMTPIGPLSFSIAQPLNAKSDDDTEPFQFTLGMLY